LVTLFSFDQIENLKKEIAKKKEEPGGRNTTEQWAVATVQTADECLGI